MPALHGYTLLYLNSIKSLLIVSQGLSVRVGKLRAAS